MAGRTLKSAPRRIVRDVQRHGDWGEVTYHHQLTCGHIEIRKRKSPHGVIACSGCVTAQEFAAGNITQRTPTSTGDGPLVDEFSGLETQAGQVRAGLVKRFGVDAEAVDVVVRGNDIAYTLVFLDADTSRRLARLDSSVDAG